MTIPTWDSLQLVSEPTILGTHSAAMSDETLYFAAMSDEPLVEDECQRLGLLLQTYSTELNNRFEQFEARQSHLEMKLTESFERTRQNLCRVEQLLSVTEKHSLPDPYGTQYDNSNPNPYGHEHYHGYSYPYYHQVCAYQIDYSNPGFYFVQFGDGSIVSMTAAGLDDLLKSSYGYFENKAIEVEPLFVSISGNMEDKGFILSRREPDSSIGNLENWVEYLPKESEVGNADKVFVESSLTRGDSEAPQVVVPMSISNSDVMKPSDEDEEEYKTLVDQIFNKVPEEKAQMPNDTQSLLDGQALLEIKDGDANASENKGGQVFEKCSPRDEIILPIARPRLGAEILEVHKTSLAFTNCSKDKMLDKCYHEYKFGFLATMALTDSFLRKAQNKLNCESFVLDGPRLSELRGRFSIDDQTMWKESNETELFNAFTRISFNYNASWVMTFKLVGDKLVSDSLASRKEVVAKGPCVGEIFEDTSGANGYIWCFLRDLDMYNDNLLVNRVISIVHMGSNLLDTGQETKLPVNIYSKDGVVEEFITSSILFWIQNSNLREFFEELEKQSLMDNRVSGWLDSCFGLVDTGQGTNVRKKSSTRPWEVMQNFQSLPLSTSPGAPEVALGIQLIAEVFTEVFMFPEIFYPFDTLVCLKDLGAEIMKFYVYWLGVWVRREYSLLVHLGVAKLPMVFDYLSEVCLNLFPNLLSNRPSSYLVEESLIMVTGNDAGKLFRYLTNYNEKGTGLMSTVLVAFFQASMSRAVDILTRKDLSIFLVDTLFLKWFYIVVMKYDEDYFQHFLVADKPITVSERIFGVLCSYCTVGLIQFMVIPKDDLSRHFQDLISFIDIELSIRIASDKKSFALPRICPIIGVASLCYGGVRISGGDYRKITTSSYLHMQIFNELVAATLFDEFEQKKKKIISVFDPGDGIICGLVLTKYSLCIVDALTSSTGGASAALMSYHVFEYTGALDAMIVAPEYAYGTFIQVLLVVAAADHCKIAIESLGKKFHSVLAASEDIPGLTTLQDGSRRTEVLKSAVHVHLEGNGILKEKVEGSGVQKVSVATFQMITHIDLHICELSIHSGASCRIGVFNIVATCYITLNKVKSSRHTCKVEPTKDPTMFGVYMTTVSINWFSAEFNLEDKVFIRGKECNEWGYFELTMQYYYIKKCLIIMKFCIYSLVLLFHVLFSYIPSSY